MLPIIKNSKIWLTFSASLVLASLVFIFTIGLNLSADFVPGTMMKLSFAKQIDNVALTEFMSKDINMQLVELNKTTESAGEYSDLGEPQVRTLSNGITAIRTLRQSDATQNYVLQSLQDKFGAYEISEIRNISPTFAQTFMYRAYVAILVAIVAIIAYIAYAFRHVPRHVEAWKFGAIAVVALIHDVTITSGIFVLLGYFLGVEIDALFITALMTILGYSVNDTIVVFDRIRENLKNIRRDESFADVAELSVNQTIGRSINTSFSTLITLFALLILGPESIRWFVLALVIGISFGTYSSIFVAAPLLTLWQKKYR